MKTYLALVCAALALLGCAQTQENIKSSWSASDAENVVWNRCENKIMEAQCNQSNQDLMSKVLIGDRTGCLIELRGRFGRARNKAQWLYIHGCPKHMVGEIVDEKAVIRKRRRERVSDEVEINRLRKKLKEDPKHSWDLKPQAERTEDEPAQAVIPEAIEACVEAELERNPNLTDAGLDVLCGGHERPGRKMVGE